MAAAIALLQLDALKTGKPSPLTVAASSSAAFVQTGIAAVAGASRDVVRAVGDAPHLYARTAAVEARNRVLETENVRLREALAQAPAAKAIAAILAAQPGGIAATTIGYDPENVARTIVLDRGADAGVARDDGVIDEDGVVGRVVDVTPATSTVLLVTDGASKIPAVVQRGRWWGIATGTNGSVRLTYVSQDAKLRAGDAVVTGRGRSFRAGLRLGTIERVSHPDGSLYQTALVRPAVTFGRLSRVVVLPH